MTIYSEIEKIVVQTIEPENPATVARAIYIQEEFIRSVADWQHFEAGVYDATQSTVFGVNTQAPGVIGNAFIGYQNITEGIYIASKVAYPLGIGRAMTLECRVSSNVTDWNILQMGFSDAIESGVGQALYFRILSGNFVTWSTNTDTDQSPGTLVPVVADTYYRLRIEINEDATEVKYYIDDNLIETVTDPSFIPKFDPNQGNYLRAWFYCKAPNGNPVTLHILNMDYINLIFQ